MQRLVLLSVFLVALSACGSDEPASGETSDGSIAGVAESIEAMPPAGTPEAASTDGATIVDLVGSAPELTTVRRLLRETGLASELTAEGPFTLFAPSDDAFSAVDLDALMADKEELRSVLRAHVLPFRTLSVDMDFEQSVETANGTMIEIVPGAPAAVASGGVRASLVRADLDAANGVVHVIDSVLLPAN